MILVTGLPRSGTSWTASILDHSPELDFYYEPDNEHNSLLGYYYKLDLPRFPYLRAGQPENGLHAIYRNTRNGTFLRGSGRPSILIRKLLGLSYERVEQEIRERERRIRENGQGDQPTPGPLQTVRGTVARGLLSAVGWVNKPPADGRTMIKSVHSVLALAYLHHHFRPRILIVLRHPANIVSSHLKLGNPDIQRTLFGQHQLVEDYLAPYREDFLSLESTEARAAAQVGAVYHVLGRQLQTHPSWLTVSHESLCRNPVKEFRKLYRDLDLDWSSDVKEKIAEMNRKGTGYADNRIASKQIGKWKRELDPPQIKEIRRGYRLFDTPFYREFSEGG